ncbi:putative methyltransferase [Phaeomoniella chlamydospora]|uniref:Putative methyltransferase n=1 Tax=Phaeomoniella chlamydospora TaxID=158046 RepID=A0A0G2G2U6_PHACM|nr:putative methyltransferase [Phaeomoniella chlamydospora]
MNQKGRKGRGGGRSGQSRGGTERTPKKDVVRYNEKYCKYYDSLNLVPKEEKEALWKFMGRDLPNSFRFTGSKAHALAVQQRLRDFYIPEIVSIKHEGEYVEAPKPVEWYPDQLAWYMTTPKNVIRRFAPFAKFQKFLVAENDVGNISRQEVVSMIPPLLMDIKPDMTVLDLCAAPGSKSAQLLEMVLAGQEERIEAAANAYQVGQTDSGYDDDGRSTGLLIANDVDYKRAHMLVHQLKRLSSANLIVTNHDATMFPSIKLPSDTSADGKPQPGKYLKFDRILADVPCSGDGTSRKNLEIWRTWTPQNALGLHVTQTRILVRALQMLKVGGRVVYSTCSMNPIEDEAVLVAAIDRCGGPEKVRLVDCSNELPKLKRFPGLKTWSVMDRTGELWHSYADVEERKREKDDATVNKLSETMFPPTDPALRNLPLEHAMRVYPHSQDTGAFFIAVLEKISEIRAKPEKESKKVQVSTSKEITVDEVKPEAAEIDGSKINASGSFEHVSMEVKPDPPSQEHSSSLKRKADDIEGDSPKKVKIEQEGITGTSAPAMSHPLPNKPVITQETSTTATAPERSECETAPSPNLLHPLPDKPPVPSKRNRNIPFEEPFKYLSPDIPELEQIRQFYKISSQFPSDRFMVRNAQGTASRNIYYTTALAKQILTENEGKGLKFVHSGVKMFVKQDVPNPDICPWRIQTDGLTVLERWVGSERIITLRKLSTLRSLLIEMFPKFSGDSWKELGEIGAQVKDVALGCCVLRIEPGLESDDLKEHMVFPLWKSVHSLNLMLPKEDRRALLLRLFNDESEVVNPMRKGVPTKPTADNTTLKQNGSVSQSPSSQKAEATKSEVEGNGTGEVMDVDEANGQAGLVEDDEDEGTSLEPNGNTSSEGD